MSKKIIQLNEGAIKTELKELVRTRLHAELLWGYVLNLCNRRVGSSDAAAETLTD